VRREEEIKEEGKGEEGRSGREGRGKRTCTRTCLPLKISLMSFDVTVSANLTTSSLHVVQKRTF